MDAGRLIPLLYHSHTAISAIKGTYSDGYTKTEKYAVYAAREWCRGQYIGGGKLKEKEYNGYKEE